MKYVLIMIFLFAYGIDSRGQRQSYSINSAWNFTLDQSPGTSEIINIPHTWNAQDAFQDGKKYYRGKGIYEKTLFVSDEWNGKRIFIHFEGANQITRMWVNGHSVGEHRGGYTGFVFELSDFIQFGEDNQLKIEVDNRHNKDIPPLEADFNFYGGIYRDVSLIITNAIHFDMVNEAAGNFLIRTPRVTENKAEFEVEGAIVNNSQKKKTVQVRLNVYTPAGKLLKTLNKKLKLETGEKNTFFFKDAIHSPVLWSPDHPNLYKAEISLLEARSQEKLDEISSTFGCRWFSIDPQKGFSLNGESIKLIGVNRHQDYEGLGNALPNAIHQRDYRLIKEMGSNFVRIAHYPHDPEAYRLCDELGLLVWSEIPIINEITNSDAFTTNSVNMQREHIMQFRNHPSVIMWGYMNEIFLRMVFNSKLNDSDKKKIISSTLKLAKQLDDVTHELDSDRLSAMALHNNNIYNSTGIADIPDVIGWNLYFGWYDATLKDLGDFLDHQHALYPERPMLITEYGPGADVRIQTDIPKPWDYSEAYQLQSHQSYYRQVMERPFILGMTAWNFADFGSSGRQDARPFINQKGLLNFDRTPKEIYSWYRAKLLKEPFVYIEGEYKEVRFCESNANEEGQVEINVFSNAETVSLSVNDSLERHFRVIDGIGSILLQLTEGNYSLKASANGVSHSRNISVLLRSKAITHLNERPICVNVGSHCDFTNPITKEVWVCDQEYKTGSWGYIGGTVFQKSKNKFQGTPINILGTDNDPLFQTMREDLEGYRFDVDKGDYRVTLLFTEHDLKAADDLIYNLSPENIESTPGLRSFSVKINHSTMVHDLNLARDYGRGRAVEISLDVKTQNGILIEFGKIAGKPILSGIKIEKR